MAALPEANPPSRGHSHKGQAGVRLRGNLWADISDTLLREFATDVLGAQRCSARYMDALRVVLGNQADAERCGYALELNQRVSFASPKVMRQVIGQMQEAGITFGTTVGLGSGRSQVVQCYCRPSRCLSESTPHKVVAETLEGLYRVQELADDARLRRDRINDPVTHGQQLAASTILAADIPH